MGTSHPSIQKYTSRRWLLTHSNFVRTSYAGHASRTSEDIRPEWQKSAAAAEEAASKVQEKVDERYNRRAKDLPNLQPCNKIKLPYRTTTLRSGTRTVSSWTLDHTGSTSSASRVVESLRATGVSSGADTRTPFQPWSNHSTSYLPLRNLSKYPSDD